MSEVISLGIGSPAGIDYFILFGLNPQLPAGPGLTLRGRDIEIAPDNRETTLTLQVNP